MRRGFTLIELIFVIVIIGILAAVAIPRYNKLKQNAEANNVIKATMDVVSSAASAAVNKRDLDENTSFTLKDIVDIQGDKWAWTTDENSTYYETTEGNVSKIQLGEWWVYYKIDCDKFTDADTETICKDKLDGNPTAEANISF